MAGLEMPQVSAGGNVRLNRSITNHAPWKLAAQAAQNTLTPRCLFPIVPLAPLLLGQLVEAIPVQAQ